MSDTPRLDLPEIDENQSQKYITHNSGLWQLDGLVQAVIEDRDLTAPPGSPVSGTVYIPTATATGDWAGEEDNLMQYRSTAWVVLIDAFEGLRVYVKDENIVIAFDGSKWIQDYALHYDIEFFHLGKPTNAQEIYRLPFVRGVTFPTALAGSQAKSRVATTGQTDFDLQKNGGSFGTMRFAASATTATFIAASPAVFAAGDYLSVIGPGTADATLEDIGFMFMGTITA